MLYALQIFDALLDPSQLLHLTRGHTALYDSVVRIKIRLKMYEVFPSVSFIIGIF